MIRYDQIEHASSTDVGIRRSHNQDNHATLLAGDAEQWHERGHVFVVADGMGAHAVGELASKLAIDNILHTYHKHAHQGASAALRKAFVEANATIHARGQQNREFAGMGTTTTALLLGPDGAWIAHVGDSRAYRVRGEQIEQLSFDHSLVWELARRQHVDPNSLQGIPSNVIVRSLGPEPLVQVDVEGPHAVHDGDVYVLCSDGLSGQVSDLEIGAIATVLPPAEACRFLVDLANLRGGPDNITVLIVRVGGPEGTSPQEKRVRETGMISFVLFPFSQLLGKLPWPFAALLLGVLLAGGAAALTFYDSSALGVIAFVLAAGALLAGLVGLAVTHAEEQRRIGVEPEPRQVRIHSHASCRIEQPLVEKLSHAAAALKQQFHEKQWDADWAVFEQHHDLAAKLLDQGDRLAAFREYCRAMRILTEALQRHRHKEEVFQPVWDKTQG